MKTFLVLVGIPAIFASFVFLGYLLSVCEQASKRDALMRNCTAQWEDGLASTVHTQTGDIEICIAGSHRMEKFQ